MKKIELMEDLEFCQELMSRLVEFADIFNDKTDVEIIKLDTVLNIIKRNLGGK